MTSVVGRLEVRRVFFRYEEDPGRGKRRPVVVALVDRTRGTALVLKVTGHGPRQGYPGEVPLLDWREAGLTKPSTVRCSKVAEVDAGLLGLSDLYGCLSLRDSMRVRIALEELGILE